MSREQIMQAIPHREPFLMVDQVVSLSDSYVVCEKTFTGEEFFFAGHYPDYPVVPGVLLCEAAMQAGAVLLSRHLPNDGQKIPVVTRIYDVRFRRMIRPGQKIRVEVELNERLADAFYLLGHVKVDGQIAARLEFACTQAEKQ